jgi:hypothetical protein
MLLYKIGKINGFNQELENAINLTNNSEFLHLLKADIYYNQYGIDAPLRIYDSLIKRSYCN